MGELDTVLDTDFLDVTSKSQANKTKNKQV